MRFLKVFILELIFYTEILKPRIKAQLIFGCIFYLISISEGIRGHKGNVSLSIGSQLNFLNDSYDAAANLITDKINELYKIHPTNIAAAIIQGKEIPVNDFSENDLDAAIIYLNERMENIADEMHPYFLDQYSNSLNI